MALPTIIGDIPAGALELDGWRGHETLDFPLKFDALFEGGVVHLLEHLYTMPAVGTFIFINRHGTCIARNWLPVKIGRVHKTRSILCFQSLGAISSLTPRHPERGEAA